MSGRKSNKAKLAEGRCRGIGAEYVPFYKSNEGGGRATCSMIPDPIEGRMVHCLSDTESMLYYLLRWDTRVVHIREQFLLDNDVVNIARTELGYCKVPPITCFTTDFLVDYEDGSQRAFSVKFKDAEFDPSSRVYQGRQYAYQRLIERQNTERKYWELLNIPFVIVTRDILLTRRIFIKNVAFIMKFWDEQSVVNEDQMILYLMAHHVYEAPLEDEFINPKKLTKEAGFDVKLMFEQTAAMRGRLLLT